MVKPFSKFDLTISSKNGYIFCSDIVQLAVSCHLERQAVHDAIPPV